MGKVLKEIKNLTLEELKTLRDFLVKAVNNKKREEKKRKGGKKDVPKKT